MKIIPTAIPEVLIVEPQVFTDERGFFFESFNARKWKFQTGLSLEFVQDNYSRSAKHVLRGLHYQICQPQGKLVLAVVGEIFDVAVDLRRYSPTFGRWIGARLSSATHRMLWVPPGFAHGYLVISEVADVLYKATDYYAPAHERCLLWSDSTVAIDWPLSATPVLSERDRRGLTLPDTEYYP